VSDAPPIKPDSHPPGLVYFDIPLQQDTRLEGLSAAERSVLRLVMRGAPNEMIAWARATSLRTVANQVASLLSKTAATSRHELCAMFGDVDLGIDCSHEPRRVRDADVIGDARTLLLVEDDDDAREELAALFRSRGFSVTACANASDARDACSDQRFEVAVVDVRLGDGHGIDLMAEVSAPTVLISGVGTFEEVATGLARGAVEFVAKTAPVDVLLGAVGDAATRPWSTHTQAEVSLDASRMSRMDAAEAAAQVLSGELRCWLITDWPGYRRVVLAPTTAPLSARMQALAREVATGAGMKQVAAHVGVSEATAWSELRRFLEHAGLDDRLQLARLLGPWVSQPG
jgi:DNA-binding NarL/FixJ family response regulator